MFSCSYNLLNLKITFQYYILNFDFDLISQQLRICLVYENNSKKVTKIINITSLELNNINSG